MPLDDTGLLVRYYCDEAASGVTPTAVEDVSGVGTPLDLAINYGAGATDLEFTEVSGNRGLQSKDTAGVQRAAVDIAAGNKVYDGLHGSKVCTFEVVCNVSVFSTSTGRLFVVNGRAGDNPLLGLASAEADASVLRTYFNEGGTPPIWEFLDGGTRVVLHVVYDTALATAGDRVKLYIDGVLATTLGGTAPAQDATIDMTLPGTNPQLIMFNRESTGTWARSVEGIVFYAAVYNVAFDATRVGDHFDILTLDDDAPAGPTLEQEGFRWRNDDGSETTATWKAAQDANIFLTLTSLARLRVLVNATGDPATTQFRLDFKKSTDGAYEVVPTAQPTITRAELTAGASTANASTYDTASVTLTAGRFYLMAITHSDAAAEQEAASIQTVGGALSFTLVDSQIFNTLASNVNRLSLWRLAAASTVTAAIRITLNDAGTGCAWIIQEYQNFDPASPIGTAVKNGVDAAASIATTPAALASTRSHQVAFGASDLNATTDVASGTNWSSVGTGQTYATPNTALECAENTSGVAQQVTFSTAGTADRAVIAVEIKALTKPIVLAASANITASGEATTAQLTAPSGKTTGDFVAGRMQDDENPADTVNITADDYTELEWCLTVVTPAVDTEIYQFRVTIAGVALDTYTLTPQLTVGTPPASFTPLRRRRSYLRM